MAGSNGLGAQSSASDQPAQTVWHSGDLTPLEEEMVAGAAAGELVGRGEGPFTLAEMHAWGEERTVRPVVLRHLLTATEWPVDPKGVRLRGVRISGLLDLEGAVVRCPLMLDACYLDADEPACLDHASVLWVTLTGCHLAGLSGEMLAARGLDLSGSTFTGLLHLPGADITGQLSCEGAQLTGSGNALVADRMKVSGGVFLRGGFTAAGAVRLLGADITGQLSCEGAQLTGSGNALVADGMKVSGDVSLDGGFTATGTVSLASVHMGATLYLMPSALADHDKIALNVAGAQIAGTLIWAPAKQVSGLVNLEGATANQLDDYWNTERPNGYWPTGGRLRLDGFTYSRLGGPQRATVKQRLAWIRSQYQPGATGNPAEFATQPYEQLAVVYRQAGQATEARKVAIAGRADLRKYGNLNPYRRFGNWLLDWTIKYGYQTWRAGAGLAVVLIVFAALSLLAQQHDLMIPAGDTEDLHIMPSATRCTSNYPCFYPVGFAIDTVIPIINVHQAANWSPDGHTPWGHAWVVTTWIATGLGWALATLLVAGYTGLVRQD